MMTNNKQLYFRLAFAALLALVMMAAAWLGIAYCPLFVTALGAWFLAALTGLGMLALYAWALDQPLVDRIFDHVND